MFEIRSLCFVHCALCFVLCVLSYAIWCLMRLPIVIGITGASGAAYSLRVIELLAAAEIEIHLAVTPLGKRLLFDELGIKRIDADALTGGRGHLLIVHNDNDLGAPIASGSFLHQGMIIVPCSSNSLGKIAAGITDNLVQRAAAVTLKER